MRNDEPHLADLRRLTFGGDNAEAYWSPDGHQLSFQRTPPGGDCDAQYLLNLDSGKVELVSNLCEFDHPEVIKALFEFAKDESEEIRVRAVEAMAKMGNEDLCDVLIDRLVDPAETQRMRVSILSLLVDRKWKVKHRKEEIRKVIPDSFWIDDVGTIKAR